MPTATRTSKLDPNVVNLDFTDLRPRSGGPRAHVPEGDYLLEVTGAEHKPVANGQNKGKPQIAWRFKIVAVDPSLAHVKEAREGIGASVYLNTRVDKESKGLFFLRNLVDDLMADKLKGASTTGAKLEFRLDDKVGLRVGATLVDGNPYNFTDDDGVEQSRVSSEIKFTYPASKFRGAAAAPAAQDDAEEAEEAPAAAPAPKAKQNGAAAAQAAAEAVTDDDGDDEDVEALDIQSL